jgi:signal transduction histidine kinase
VAVVSEPLDIVINTGAVLGAAAVAALAWARYRVTAEARSFYQAAAFLTLASINAVALAILTLGRGPEFGFSLENPGPIPIISFVLTRFVAAALLLVGGVAALRRAVVPRPGSGLLLFVPPVGTLGLLGLLSLGGDALVPPLTAEALQHLRTQPTTPLELSSLSGGLFVVQLTIGLMFLAGAWLAYRAAAREGRPADAFLAIGLVLAAFSQVHAALNPGSYASLVTTGDFLRVAFYAALLAGVIVQSRSDVRAIQEGNAELRLLREADVHSAMLEERGRLAREVHDGLAQDLWYARLKQGKLVSVLEEGEPRLLAEEVMDAIDRGIADARQTVMAMRAGSTDAPLLDVVGQYVDDFGDRFAIKAEFESDGEAPDLPPRVQAELLRIVQEALNNVRKHADATVVRVRAASVNGSFQLVVSDNGRGFVPDRTGDGFGLMSMRQRAELIGATLQIESAQQDGTRVSVSLPGRSAAR